MGTRTGEDARILVLEASLELARLFEQFGALSPGMRFRVLPDPTSMAAALSAGFSPDAAVIDAASCTAAELEELRLRLRQSDERLPLILLCNETRPDRDGPWSAVLSKPFSFSAITSEIRRLLERPEEEERRFTEYPPPKAEELADLSRRVEADPADHRLRHMLAFGLYSGKRFAEALVHYEILHGEGHRDYVLLYYLGQTRSRLARWRDAAEAWEEALEHAPSEEAEKRLHLRIAQALELADGEEAVSK